MCSHAHVNKWIMVHFRPRTHIQWLIHSIASPYCQHSADRKQSFHKMLATTEQKPNLEQSTPELSKCLTVFFLMPEFDGTATKRTCVDVSDVLINVASDRSDHQCCGSCMAWLGCSCSASLAARSGKYFNAVVDVLVLVVEVVVLECKSGKITKVSL